VPENKIVVTYPGIKFEIRNSKSETNSKFKMQNSKFLKTKYGIEGDYVLFVGTLQPRKNIARLIEAFSRIKDNTQLVVVGKKGWLYEEILEAPKKFGVQDRVKFLDFVPDEDLPLFYQNALCFVLPSLYEGFGLPVLEAMKYGCPVITSNVSSLPEAGGDAALYFNPEDISDIAANLRLMITKPQLRKELIKKGFEQIKKFSWEKTARETLKTLMEVVNNGKSY
jgi:glycosyltransferase involved in cell wall biosynthesis